MIYHYSFAPHGALMSKALQNRTIPAEQTEWVKKSGGIAEYDTHISFFVSVPPIKFIIDNFPNHPFAVNGRKLYKHDIDTSALTSARVIGWSMVETDLEDELRKSWNWKDKSEANLIRYKKKLRKLMDQHGLRGYGVTGLEDCISRYKDIDMLEAYTKRAILDKNSAKYASYVPHLMVYVKKKIIVKHCELVR